MAYIHTVAINHDICKESLWMNWLVVLKWWNVGLCFFSLEASFFVAICHWQPGWPDFLYFDLRKGSLGQKLKRQHALRAVGPTPRNLLRAVKFFGEFDQAVLTGGLCRNKEQAILSISFAPKELLWPDQLLSYPEREPRKMPSPRALRSKLWHDIRKGLRQLAFSFPLWLGPRRHNYANWRHLFTAFRAIKPWDCVECLRLSNLQPAILKISGLIRSKKLFGPRKFFF